MELAKHFDIWFGGIFFLLGTASLGTALVLLAFWRRGGSVRQPASAGRPPAWALAAPLIVGVVFSLVGGGFLGYGIQQYRTEQRLLTEGVVMRATVVTVEPTSTRVNGEYLWRVRYEYRDWSGQPHEGVSGYLDRREAHTYLVGDPALVRYDPQAPDTSIWLGRSDRASLTHRQVAGGASLRRAWATGVSAGT